MTDHKADTSGIRKCNILGVNIAEVNMESLLHFTIEHIKELSGDYMCVSNVHTTVMAFEDESYRSVQNGAVLAIPDGGPLSSVGHKRGYDQMERTTGPSYMEEILKLSSQYGWKHFFYGSTVETTNLMIKSLKEKYPDLNIVGVYNPPFRLLTEVENQEIIELINDSNPDFIWVGLGAPKQEIWMAEHQNRVHGFMVGVGAAFDYLAGNISRAPEWMQKHNLEWFYRLMQDPKRLFYRYFHTNTSFIWNAVIRGK